MGDVKKDKELLEKLEIVLKSAEEIPVSADEDNRTALEFARKMAVMKVTPSEEFSGNLKARLVHQLSEQEKKSRSGGIELDYWGIPRRKKWQGTLAAFIAVLIIAAILVIVLVLT